MIFAKFRRIQMLLSSMLIRDAIVSNAFRRSTKSSQTPSLAFNRIPPPPLPEISGEQGAKSRQEQMGGGMPGKSL